jgi:formylglycine-generating enzyme required for sulfatase activity
METSAPDTQALPAGTRLEEFMIERVLGSGGFGITYLARDTSLNRQVVVKENLPSQFVWRETATGTVRPRHSTGSDADDFEWSMRNFLREAETLASLDHTGIVRVLRKFEANCTGYFVMPFVQGVEFGSLIAKRAEKGQPFTEEELRGLTERLLDALSYLHDRGIYHRDLKPGNILITNEGVPVLIDFGSARQRLSERSMTVVESAGYTPFEQLQSRGNVGPWSDLYALGGTLFKALTGETPPKANDRMPDDRHVALAWRRDFAGRYSPEFLTSIDRAMSMRVTDRWQHAQEWLTELRCPVNASAVVEDNLPPHPIPPPLPRFPSASPALPPTPRRAGSANQTANRVGWSIGACLVLLSFWALFSLDQPEETQQQAKSVQTVRPPAQDTTQNAEIGNQAGPRAAKSETGDRPGEEREFEIAPGAMMKMCWIPPGDFLMGHPADELAREGDETHRVTLTQGFWLGKYEVTQAQWEAVMGNNPSKFNGTNLPVETVSWNDISGTGGFLENVNRHDTPAGQFHLPTEAQWEYACRAGTTTALNSGEDLTSSMGACLNLTTIAWYGKNSNEQTHRGGLKKGNAWGLHDMLGNVWEWCADMPGNYPAKAIIDPPELNSGSYRVLRGGSWYNFANYCHAASRCDYYPTRTNDGIGFRLARSSVP